ncbi:hypothetical protein JW851_04090 [Candidatus Woesearchaeota archaeon]|nr:hypothetical protein [Candidatus Woesearchaeota archaeon]
MNKIMKKVNVFFVLLVVVLFFLLPVCEAQNDYSRKDALKDMSFVDPVVDPVTRQKVGDIPDFVSIKKDIPVVPKVFAADSYEVDAFVSDALSDLPSREITSVGKSSSIIGQLSYEQDVFNSVVDLSNVDEDDACVMPSIPGAEVSGAGFDATLFPASAYASYGGDGLELVEQMPVRKKAGDGGESAGAGASFARAQDRLNYLQTIENWGHETYQQGATMAMALSEFAKSQEAQKDFGKNNLAKLGSSEKWSNVADAMNGAYNGLHYTAHLYAESLGTFKKITSAVLDKSGKGAGSLLYNYAGLKAVCSDGHGTCSGAMQYYGTITARTTDIENIKYQIKQLKSNTELSSSQKKKKKTELELELKKAESYLDKAKKGIDQKTIDTHNDIENQLEKEKDPEKISELLKKKSDLTQLVHAHGGKNNINSFQTILQQQANELGLSNPNDALTYMGWQYFDAKIAQMVGQPESMAGAHIIPGSGLHGSLEQLTSVFNSAKEFLPPEFAKKVNENINKHKKDLVDLGKDVSDLEKDAENAIADGKITKTEDKNHKEKQHEANEKGLELASEMAKDFKEILKELAEMTSKELEQWWTEMSKSKGEKPGSPCCEGLGCKPPKCPADCPTGIYGKKEAKEAGGNGNAPKGANAKAGKPMPAGSVIVDTSCSFEMVTGLVVEPGPMPVEPPTKGEPWQKGPGHSSQCITREECPSFPEPEEGDAPSAPPPEDLNDVFEKSSSTEIVTSEKPKEDLYAASIRLEDIPSGKDPEEENEEELKKAEETKIKLEISYAKEYGLSPVPDSPGLYEDSQGNFYKVDTRGYGFVLQTPSSIEQNTVAGAALDSAEESMNTATTPSEMDSASQSYSDAVSTYKNTISHPFSSEQQINYGIATNTVEDKKLESVKLRYDSIDDMSDEKKEKYYFDLNEQLKRKLEEVEKEYQDSPPFVLYAKMQEVYESYIGFSDEGVEIEEMSDQLEKDIDNLLKELDDYSEKLKSSLEQAKKVAKDYGDKISKQKKLVEQHLDNWRSALKSVGVFAGAEKDPDYYRQQAELAKNRISELASEANVKLSEIKRNIELENFGILSVHKEILDKFDKLAEKKRNAPDLKVHLYKDGQLTDKGRQFTALKAAEKAAFKDRFSNKALASAKTVLGTTTAEGPFNFPVRFTPEGDLIAAPLSDFIPGDASIPVKSAVQRINFATSVRESAPAFNDLMNIMEIKGNEFKKIVFNINWLQSIRNNPEVIQKIAESSEWKSKDGYKNSVIPGLTESLEPSEKPSVPYIGSSISMSGESGSSAPLPNPAGGLILVTGADVLDYLEEKGRDITGNVKDIFNAGINQVKIFGEDLGDAAAETFDASTSRENRKKYKDRVRAEFNVEQSLERDISFANKMIGNLQKDIEKEIEQSGADGYRLAALYWSAGQISHGDFFKVLKDGEESIRKIASENPDIDLNDFIDEISELKNKAQKKSLKEENDARIKDASVASGEHYDAVQTDEEKGLKTLAIAGEVYFEKNDVRYKKESAEISNKLKKGAGILNDLNEQLIVLQKKLNRPDLNLASLLFHWSWKDIDGSSSQDVKEWIDKINYALELKGDNKLDISKYSSDDLRAFGLHWGTIGSTLAEQVDGSYVPDDSVVAYAKISNMKKQAGDLEGALTYMKIAEAYGVITDDSGRVVRTTVAGEYARREVDNTDVDKGRRASSRIISEVVFDPFIICGAVIKAGGASIKLVNFLRQSAKFQKLVKFIETSKFVNLPGVTHTIGATKKVANVGISLGKGTSKILGKAVDPLKGNVNTKKIVSRAEEMLKTAKGNDAKNLEKVIQTGKSAQKELGLFTGQLGKSGGKYAVKSFARRIENEMNKFVNAGGTATEKGRQILNNMVSKNGIVEQFNEAAKARQIIESGSAGVLGKGFLRQGPSKEFANHVKNQINDLENAVKNFENVPTPKNFAAVSEGIKAVEKSKQIGDAYQYMRLGNRAARAVKRITTNSLNRVIGSKYVPNVQKASQRLRSAEISLGNALKSGDTDAITRAFGAVDDANQGLKNSKTVAVASKDIRAVKEAPSTKPKPVVENPEMSAEEFWKAIGDVSADKYANNIKNIRTDIPDLSNNVNAKRIAMELAEQELQESRRVYRLAVETGDETRINLAKRVEELSEDGFREAAIEYNQAKKALENADARAQRLADALDDVLAKDTETLERILSMKPKPIEPIPTFKEMPVDIGFLESDLNKFKAAKKEMDLRYPKIEDELNRLGKEYDELLDKQVKGIIDQTTYERSVDEIVEAEKRLLQERDILESDMQVLEKNIAEQTEKIKQRAAELYPVYENRLNELRKAAAEACSEGRDAADLYDEYKRLSQEEGIIVKYYSPEVPEEIRRLEEAERAARLNKISPAREPVPEIKVEKTFNDIVQENKNVLEKSTAEQLAIRKNEEDIVGINKWSVTEEDGKYIIYKNEERQGELTEFISKERNDIMHRDDILVAEKNAKTSVIDDMLDSRAKERASKEGISFEQAKYDEAKKFYNANYDKVDDFEKEILLGIRSKTEETLELAKPPRVRLDAPHYSSGQINEIETSLRKMRNTEPTPKEIDNYDTLYRGVSVEPDEVGKRVNEILDNGLESGLKRSRGSINERSGQQLKYNIEQHEEVMGTDSIVSLTTKREIADGYSVSTMHPNKHSLVIEIDPSDIKRGQIDTSIPISDVQKAEFVEQGFLDSRYMHYNKNIDGYDHEIIFIGDRIPPENIKAIYYNGETVWTRKPAVAGE